MKKVSLLLAAAALAWLTGCGGPGEFLFFPDYGNMEDTYYLTKATVNGVTPATSEISGTIVLSGNTYSIDVTIPGMHYTRSGTYDLPDDLADLSQETVLCTLDGGEGGFLAIKDNGLKLSYSTRWRPPPSDTIVLEFTRPKP